MTYATRSGSWAPVTWRGRAVWVLSVLLGSGALAHAAKLSKLHVFDCTDGGSHSALAQGRDGNLYGIGVRGGAFGDGTAFKLTPNGVYTKLHDFQARITGSSALGLTLGKDGNFYALGSGGHGGAGTVFKMTPAGAVTVLHEVNRRGDGCYPEAPLIQGRDGSLYGRIRICGSNPRRDVIYKITAAGVYSELYRFGDDSGTGTYPLGYKLTGPLVQAADGALYGPTQLGGKFGGGTVFKLTTRGNASTIYDIDRRHKQGDFFGGEYIRTLIQGTDGNLYGIVDRGGAHGRGYFFKLTLAGAFTVLHSFERSPYSSSLVQGSDGNFYGGTEGNSRRKNDGGFVFRLTPAGDFAVMAEFRTRRTADRPYPRLLHTNGKIYGVARGGALGCGTLYSLDVDAPSFISAQPSAARAGSTIALLGAMDGATEVTFNGLPAAFAGTRRMYRTAVVPNGAATGLIAVTTPGGTSTSFRPFLQLPTLTGFSPDSGAAGSAVVVTGNSLTQTTKVKFGGGKPASFVVDSDSQITVTVPADAKPGRIHVTTSGGTVSTSELFTPSP